ncbi:NHL repeat-containing protein [Paraburkholderia bannensis]|uniref:hypothetical protein n=1 Tax=Paraburkholderia bannensis TaxID=765414 RepID=UPI002ABE1AF0|nr:hypothetical protein [Paraburkholderia bannensis]
MSPPAADRISIDAKPNGVAIRASDDSLFVTDDRRNVILWSHDHATFARYADVREAPGQPNSLGAITITPSGELLVARFGFGEAGALFIATSSGDTQPLTGLAPERRRLGLASIGPGRVLSSWFVKAKGVPSTAGISLVSYDTATHAASERDLVAGLAKPVGVAVRGDTLFVADQDGNVVLRYSLAALLAAPAPVSADRGTVFARIEHPDLLAIDKTGALYTKCGASGLCRIAPDGTVTSLANDFQNARGIAIDETKHALYVVDRASASSATGSAIRILPLAPAN